MSWWTWKVVWGQSIKWEWGRWGETLAHCRNRFKSSEQCRGWCLLALLFWFRYIRCSSPASFLAHFLSLQSLTAVSERLWKVVAQFSSGAGVTFSSCNNSLPHTDLMVLAHVDLTSVQTPLEAVLCAAWCFLAESLLTLIHAEGFPIQSVSLVFLTRTSVIKDKDIL